VKFFRLRNAVVIRINPEAQRRKYRVAGIDNPVAVSAVFWQVVNCQCSEAVGIARQRLRSEAAKEFFAIVDQAIGTRKRQECIACSRCCPSHLDWISRTRNVELHAVRDIR
jgi:hypothetical protein